MCCEKMLGELHFRGPGNHSVNRDTKSLQKSVLKRAKCHSQLSPFHVCNTPLKWSCSFLLLLLLLLLSFHPLLFRPFSLTVLLLLTKFRFRLTSLCHFPQIHCGERPLFGCTQLKGQKEPELDQ